MWISDEGGEGIDAGNDSWSGWAWSVGSSVGTALLPVYWEDDDGDGAENAPPLDAKRDAVTHLGVYVDSASLVVKLVEHTGDHKSMFGSMKQSFSPFIRTHLEGIFAEVVVKGMGLVNVTGGVSRVTLAPVGGCLTESTDSR